MIPFLTNHPFKTSCRSIEGQQPYNVPHDILGERQPYIITCTCQTSLACTDAQWIGHILKRFHLVDEARRKRQSDGIAYVVHPLEVVDMMRRYHVTTIPTDEPQNRS